MNKNTSQIFFFLILKVGYNTVVKIQVLNKTPQDENVPCILVQVL